ncbi:uncharacterized protein N7503_001056 [Penicillium pulvis]|uniref:uncharacterized protein n=1 Tax=Penicillium pulvis TaxID=1562058 RepID=UPI002547717F|nr:uncharacterized protein N7503_001056 [Penicillium pulvis]KAJ5814306.1 hypothetical protein N7503_001056 [Penicillium pulvis]
MRYAGSGGDDQALAYMGCVHQERKRTPGRSATVYGITTDSKEWRFLRINDQGEWALAVYPYEEEDNYEKVATMLAFIMHQAVILSPYASKTHSKEVSTEDA